MTKTRTSRLLAIAVLAVAANKVDGTDRMVGVVPTDGSTMLIKQFSVDAGTTITGVQLENNDAATTFPEVALLRGPLASIADGTVVAAASNVRPGAGVATVSWPSPVSVAQPGTYYVVVRFPSGPGRQGAGRGPALAANNATSPGVSYAAASGSAPLVPIRADLAITLVTGGSSGGGLTKSGNVIPEEPVARATGILTAKVTDGGFPATVSFRLEETNEVVVTVYDVSGRHVRTLLHATLAAGSHERRWDGRDDRGSMSASGIYMIQLKRGAEVLTQKLVITK